MRLASFEGGFGRVEGDALIPMGESLVGYLRTGKISQGKPLVLKDVSLIAPVPSPGKIICVGLNYIDHAAESGMDPPTTPVIFTKFANSVVGPNETVFVPSAAQDVDYEAELGVVIGRRAREVPRAVAREYIAGYTCVNDLSSRSLQFLTSQWVLGKAVDGFLPMGPYLVTPDAVSDPQALEIRCEVDGEVRQQSSTSEMIFSIFELIEFITRTITLEVGDVIATGTPAGVGMGFNPPRYLELGSEVAVEIEGVGRLVNRLEARR